MLITVAQAAERTGRRPETIRRWLRSGKLQAQKVGIQHMVDEEDLDLVDDDTVLPIPES